jgi:hypothetical protein
MQGRVSAKLDRMLRDKKARGQLRDLLIKGESGRVTANGKTYTVNTEVRGDKNS